MYVVGYLRFETGDQIVENINMFGHYGCLAFRITGGDLWLILLADIYSA